MSISHDNSVPWAVFSLQDSKSILGDGAPFCLWCTSLWYLKIANDFISFIAFHQHLRTNLNSSYFSSSYSCIFIAYEKKNRSWDGKSENHTAKCFVVAPEIPRQLSGNDRRAISSPIHKMSITELDLVPLTTFYYHGSTHSSNTLASFPCLFPSPHCLWPAMYSVFFLSSAWMLLLCS